MIIDTKKRRKEPTEIHPANYELSSIISIRFSNKDLQMLKEKAKAENRTMSNYIKTQLQCK